MIGSPLNLDRFHGDDSRAYDVPAWSHGHHTQAELDAMTPEQRRNARRTARHGREHEQIANALVAMRELEWGAQYDLIAMGDGVEIRVARPTYRRRVSDPPPMPSPRPPRVRERGSYTRELVRATTRGHDHAPERPIDDPVVDTGDGWGGYLDWNLAHW